MTVLDHHKGTRVVQARSQPDDPRFCAACVLTRSRPRDAQEVADPMQVCIDLSKHWKPHRNPGLPTDAFCGAFAR